MSGSINADFLALINANIGIAYKVCRIYFKEPGDQEDVMQEMMYQLWRSFANFDNRSKFSTWMYSVCLNTALTYRKKAKKVNPDAISSAHDQIPDMTPENDEEAVSQLYHAISMLSPLNRAIVMLYLEELTYEEIAQITGLSRSNVSVRLVRIKKELEKLMKRTNS
jgi:RNA polymerase sigma factor (sigma-70 family)